MRVTLLTTTRNMKYNKAIILQLFTRYLQGKICAFPRPIIGYWIDIPQTLMYMMIHYYNNHCCFSTGQSDWLEMVSYGSFRFDQTRYNVYLSLKRLLKLVFEDPEALAEESKKKVFVCVKWSGKDCMMYLLIASEIYCFNVIFCTRI